MTSQPDTRGTEISGTKRWLPDIIFCLGCGLLVGIFTWFADTSSPFETVYSKVNEDSYNLLVQGFSAGQLNLKEEAPLELAKLSDPYDPNVNGPYIRTVGDLTYYKGKLYLYFGVTPALVFFWPYYALTGHFLSEKDAIAFFMAIGFAAIAGILRTMRGRYFPETSKWIPVAGTLLPGLALALTLPVNVHETVIACGFGFAMLALAAIWAALHEPGQRVLWLALASLAYGLAIGARPNLLFGAVILLLPLLQAWRQSSSSAPRLQPARAPYQPTGMAASLLAVTAPIACVGFGLMLYNFLRFNNPFEFGLHYQLNSSYRPPSAHLFGLNNFWFNFRLYFLEPIIWGGQFPFLKSAPLPPLPAGYDFGTVNGSGGILITYPVVLFILAVPLAWKCKLRGTALGWFATACLCVFLAGTLSLTLYFASANTYELDFLPGLLLLTLVGTYSAARAALPFPGRRRLVCFGWFLLTTYSIALNALANVEARAESEFFVGNLFLAQGRLAEAKTQYQKTLALFPACADAYGGLGNVLFHQGHVDEAIVDYQKAVEINPSFVEAQNNLGYCCLEKGRLDDAIGYYKKAANLRPGFVKYRSALGNAYARKGLFGEAIAQYQTAADIQPGSADIHERLGDALFQKGQLESALVQYQRVIELQPGFAQAHNNLGYCFQKTGRESDAIAQYQKAVELDPSFASAYNNLGNAYREQKMAAQAIAVYQKAADLAPQLVPARLNLAWMLATWPDTGVRNGNKALALALRLNDLTQGNDPKILRTLAAAYAEMGKFDEASATAKKAMALAQSDVALTNALQTEIGLYQARTPVRSTDNF
ncbi:MAG TPA: tetratricopeptide repeat protein [Verrucomicrobiae bacterium]|jgi:tetratricopeptide (TPR) repeat protein|nr:tetratricopeptide repeat protein [Verrucomicrobiae bacterium]